MGGGSSDAATTLLALNRLWGLNYNTETLIALAAPLGADIPFFIVGSAVAFISAIAAIRIFISILGRNTLKPFAIYRLILAVPVYFFMVR